MSSFNIAQQPDTHVEVDSQQVREISDWGPFTRCGWTPFAGMAVHSTVRRVILRGNVVFEYGQVLAEPGPGQ